MATREAKQYKALYFDLFIAQLKLHYPKKNHLGAYRDIKKYFLKHGFTHEQWSGYHSKEKTTDLNIFDLVDDMTEKMPWFWQCVNHFEVTNIGRNYDLMLRKPVDDIIEIID